jgi:hypothetical protein
MTGPAEGKLGLDSKVFLLTGEGKVELEDVFVCIHLKGFSRARVTHLDIEHDLLDNLILPKRGSLRDIEGIEGGIEISLEEKKEVVYQGKRIKPYKLQIFSPLLNKVLEPEQKTRTWVGGKFGGIYIGFRKAEIWKLEEIGEKEFNMHPG